MEIKTKLFSCDFEENTLTVKLPDGFWEQGYEIQRGEATIITDGISMREKPKQSSQ